MIFKKNNHVSLWIGFLLVFFSSLSSEETHNNLLPNLRLLFTPASYENSDAFSFLGEAGARNFRGSVTYGTFLTTYQRFKVTGEYLTQRLKYRFVDSDKEKWVSQVGFGGAYEYLTSYKTFKSFEAGVAYSHAFNRNLGRKLFFDDPQQIQFGRRIAGSDAFLSYLGTRLQLWHCGFFSASANYDHVTYRRIFNHDAHVQGFGASVDFTQQFGKEFYVNLDAEIRSPFNFYEASINWSHLFCSWGINCGLYGNYTQGKRHLPNVAAAGVQLGFSIGGKGLDCSKNSCRSSYSRDCTQRFFCDITNWTASPALYSPVVLAIKDPASNCSSFPTSSPIPNLFLSSGGQPYTYDVSGFFSSSLPLTFSATGFPDGSSIDPVTGVISGINPGDNIPRAITVTATSGCGSTSQAFVISYFNIE